MNITWDAGKYTADFSFVHQYGNSMIQLIDAKPGSKVLDLGCGNGALSQALQQKGFQVTGLDASRELLAVAEKEHPDIRFVLGDATDFSLPEPVDVVFSNAVFHWIDGERQQDMLRCVYRSLTKGGEFVFEMGGSGNNRLIHQALAEVFEEHHIPYRNPFYFPTIGEYASRLEQVGFRVVYALHFDRLTELKGENGLSDWIRMFVKTPFAAVDSKQEQDDIIAQAVERLREKLYQGGKWYADYVRLRMKAIKE